MPPKFPNTFRKNSIHLEVVHLSFFDFKIPTAEEIERVLQQARDDPGSLDGRDMWIYRMLKGGDF